MGNPDEGNGVVYYEKGVLCRKISILDHHHCGAIMEYKANPMSPFANDTARLTCTNAGSSKCYERQCTECKRWTCSFHWDLFEGGKRCVICIQEYELSKCRKKRKLE